MWSSRGVLSVSDRLMGKTRDEDSIAFECERPHNKTHHKVQEA